MALIAESTQVFRHVIEPDQGSFSPGAQEGTPTAQEADELNSYLHADRLLAILRLGVVEGL